MASSSSRNSYESSASLFVSLSWYFGVGPNTDRRITIDCRKIARQEKTTNGVPTCHSENSHSPKPIRYSMPGKAAVPGVPSAILQVFGDAPNQVGRGNRLWQDFKIGASEPGLFENLAGFPISGNEQDVTGRREFPDTARRFD